MKAAVGALGIFDRKINSATVFLDPFSGLTHRSNTIPIRVHIFFAGVSDPMRTEKRLVSETTCLYFVSGGIVGVDLAGVGHE